MLRLVSSARTKVNPQCMCVGWQAPGLSGWDCDTLVFPMFEVGADLVSWRTWRVRGRVCFAEVRGDLAEDIEASRVGGGGAASLMATIQLKKKVVARRETWPSGLSPAFRSESGDCSCFLNERMSVMASGAINSGGVALRREAAKTARRRVLQSWLEGA